MSTDDPFFGDDDSDRTVIKPSPGRGRKGTPPRQPPPSAPGPAASPPRANRAEINRAPTPGLNPLVDSASALLALAPQLRTSASHSDPQALNQHLCGEMQKFEQRAKQRGCSPEHVLAGRYALCTFLDEAVLATPWGSNSGWSEKTLLSTFHREGFGGEKFFSILERVAQEPAKNINLIELQYVILGLGFKGKYNVQDRGGQEIQGIQDRLFQLIKQHRGDINQELSPRWRGEQDLRNPLQEFLPLWVVAAAGAALLVAVFTAFHFKLGSESAPVARKLATIGLQQAELDDRRVSQARRMDITRLLAPEIEQGLVIVDDRPGRSIITLPGAGLFGPGSAKVPGNRRALLERVGEALNTEAGKVEIIGHTDNIPISGALRLKFPTNFDLSEARADAIMQALQVSGVAAARMRSEGRGELEPMVENDSRAGRAKNRRVEITLSARSQRYQ